MAAAELPQAVLFDLDGTLYSARFLPAALGLYSAFDLRLLLAVDAARRAKAGVDFGSADALRDAIVLDACLRLGGADAGEVNRWYGECLYARFVGALGAFFSARPCVVRYLEARRTGLLPAGPRLGVLSDYSHVDDRLFALGLDPMDFEVRVSSEDEGALKPAPRSFLRAASLLGVEPARVLMVGDSYPLDAAGARAAGMPFRRLAGDRDARALFRDLSGGLVPCRP